MSVVLGALILGVGFLGVWLGPKVLSVKHDLEAALEAFPALKDPKDLASMKASVDVIAAKAEDAALTSDDPVWRFAEHLPVVGDNLRAVRVVSTTVSSLANDVGKPLLDVQTSGDGQLLARSLPLIEQATTDLSGASSELADLSQSSQLVEPVRQAVAQVGDALGVVEPALAVIPPLLGADREMNYLLVFQNNAEVLPLGGSAASQTLVTANQGDVEIAAQGDSTKFRNGTAVDVPVDASALDLYGRYLVDHVNTAVTRPDFPTAARILRAFWQRDIDPGPVDAVISVDPLALSRILRATGPVDVNDIEINADNAVRILLSDSYAWWDPSKGPEEQAASDGFFEAVARGVFARVASGSFDIQTMISGVRDSIDAGSIMIWSDDPEIAPLVSGQRVAGALPTDNSDATTVGVFFRDSSEAKIDYYMASAVSVSGTCVDGTGSFAVDARLHLDLTTQDALALPDYVATTQKVYTGFTTQVIVYGPPGTKVSGTSSVGRDIRVISTDTDDLGRPVAILQTLLTPGEEASVHVSFVGAGEFGPLQVRSTPMIRPTAISVEDACQ